MINIMVRILQQREKRNISIQNIKCAANEQTVSFIRFEGKSIRGFRYVACVYIPAKNQGSLHGLFEQIRHGRGDDFTVSLVSKLFTMTQLWSTETSSGHNLSRAVELLTRELVHVQHCTACRCITVLKHVEILNISCVSEFESVDGLFITSKHFYRWIYYHYYYS